MAVYTTAAEEEAYFTTRLNTTPYDDATTADKLAARTMATKAFEQLNYVGEMADEDQDLQFPRGDDTAIPQVIKDACCEEMLNLLDGADPQIEFENLGLVSERYANINARHDPTSPSEHIAAGITSVTAWRLLLPFLRDGRAIRVERIS